MPALAKAMVNEAESGFTGVQYHSLSLVTAGEAWAMVNSNDFFGHISTQ